MLKGIEKHQAKSVWWFPTRGAWNPNNYYYFWSTIELLNLFSTLLICYYINKMLYLGGADCIWEWDELDCVLSLHLQIVSIISGQHHRKQLHRLHFVLRLVLKLYRMNLARLMIIVMTNSYAYLFHISSIFIDIYTCYVPNKYALHFKLLLVKIFRGDFRWFSWKIT